MKKQRGITLIALVITIIVLLILAGITIATLTGNNGILTRAEEARNKTEQAQKNEENILISYEEKINEYAGINWDTALANAQKHPDQKTSTAIGVGTDGKSVNMDLWECTLLKDGTYALNDENVFVEEYIASSGYDNNNIVDGKIQGTIPQYIKDSNDEDFIPVTNLNYLFYNTDLTEVPVIPDTVISMRGTFNKTKITRMPEIPNGVTNLFGTFASCTNLTETCAIPDSVTDMTGTFTGCSLLEIAPKLSENTTTMENTFQNCTSLKTAPKIPDLVKNMTSTFSNCTSLTIAPIIPNKVENMNKTFFGCKNLTTVKVIPESVKILQQTFQDCINLRGEIEINANITDISNCYIPFFNATTENVVTLKVKGSCPVLSEIISNANNPNITL